MKNIDTLKSNLTKNYNTIKLLLTDIVAATESGFGSQPIDNQSNWLIGHILIHRISLLNYFQDLLQTELDWSSDYTTSYLLVPTSSNSNERKSYASLLIDLKQSQTSITNLLGILEPEYLLNSFTVQQKNSNDANHLIIDLLAENIQITRETPICTALTIIVEKESQLTVQLVQQQRQSSKTGIY